MISIFRRYINSRVGIAIGALFLGMIGIAFVLGDIEHKESGSWSLFGSDRVAKVGGSGIGAQDLQAGVQRDFENARRMQPGLTIANYLNEGGLEATLGRLISFLAIERFTADEGVHISKRLVDGQIAGISAFHDASGKFSQQKYDQLIAAQGLTDKELREGLTKDLLRNMLTGPAGFGVTLPDSLALPYASLLLEQRTGSIAIVPSQALAPTGDPKDADLAAFYKTNAKLFTIPEQRKLRYAIVDVERFAGAATPSDAEIATYYARNKARYAASETRAIEQLILPTEAAARAALGKPLAQSAKAAGLEVATIPAASRADLARATSDAVAAAAFVAEQGQVAGPVKSAFGWAVFRVSAVNRKAAVTLDAARADIVKELTAQKQAQLLTDFAAKLENQSDDGATFDEIVKDNGLAVVETPLVVADGKSPENMAFQGGADLPVVLKVGFSMEADDEPQMAQITANQRYAFVDVADIVAPAPPPLAKVRELVVAQYKLSQGAKRARAVADKIKAAADRGTPLAAAIAQAGVPLPAAQPVSAMRGDLLNPERRPPAQLALLFAVPQGTVKVMPAGGERGYFVIRLDSITPGDAKKVAGLVDKVRKDLSPVYADEYARQLISAVEREVGVKRNAKAIAQATRSLRGASDTSGQ